MQNERDVKFIFFISKHRCALREMKNDRAFINKRQKLKLTYWWETYKAKTFFIKKAERPEWMNILGFSVINDGIMKNVPKFISLGAAKRKEKIYLCYYEMISLINHFTVYRFNLSSFYYPLTSLALFKWVIRFWLPYTRDFLPAHFWF